MIKVLEIDVINGEMLRGQRADKVVVDARALHAFVNSPLYSKEKLQRFVSDCRLVTSKTELWSK